MKAPLVLRAADRVATPWKNGGGVTREVAIFPTSATFDSFSWRISMAEVRADGPFSNFPGIDRQLAVIEGTLSLKVGGDSAIQLSADSEPLALAGDVPTCATVVAGPVTDLNVMTRRGRIRSTLRRHLVREPERMQTAAATTVLVARDEISIIHGGVQHTLGAFDAMLIEPITQLTLATLSQGSSSSDPLTPMSQSASGSGPLSQGSPSSGPSIPSIGRPSNLNQARRSVHGACYIIELFEESPLP